MTGPVERVKTPVGGNARQTDKRRRKCPTRRTDLAEAKLLTNQSRGTARAEPLVAGVQLVDATAGAKLVQRIVSSVAPVGSSTGVRR
jgi:hypothetical protein